MDDSLDFGNLNISDYHPEHMDDPDFCYGTLSPQVGGMYLINLVYAPCDLDLPQSNSTKRQEKIAKLINSGADVTLENDYGTTALDYAISNELEISTAIITAALIKRGDKQSLQVLRSSCQTAKALAEIKNSSFIGSAVKSIETALSTIEKDFEKLQEQREAENVRKLKEMREAAVHTIFKGCHPYDLDKQDFDYANLTPQQAGQYLVTLLANPTSARNLKTKDLDIGNSEDRLTKIKALLDCDASLQTTNENGFSALDYAVQNGLEVAVHLISNALSSTDQDLPVSAYKTIKHAEEVARGLKTPFGKATAQLLAEKKKTAHIHAKAWHAERYTP